VPEEVRKRFDVHLVYQHNPCFKGRIFNQYSYLQLYRHVSAEYVFSLFVDGNLGVSLGRTVLLTAHTGMNFSFSPDPRPACGKLFLNLSKEVDVG
jgi:hypothetical protein